MRFASLGSGSRGNATLVDAGGTRLLVDCGFSARDVERRLGELGVAPADLDAILVTHEHSDHVRGVATLSTRYRLPVWSTPGTWKGAGGASLPRLRLFSIHDAGFRIGDLRILPFPIPHDAREPCQFIIESAGQRLGMLTDAGNVTRHIAQSLSGCDALLLESNHDPEMLRDGPYPPALQARVGGGFGHLSNYQAAKLVDGLPHQDLRHLVIAHISEKNNSPQRVRAAFQDVNEGLGDRLALVSQDCPSAWFDI